MEDEQITTALSAKLSDRILEPMDRISEVLFGLIMALTFTLTLGVVTADRIQVRTMLLAALGLQPGLGNHRRRRVSDGSVQSKGAQHAMQLRAVRQAADAANARRIIADAFPPLLASTLRPEQLEVIRQRLLQLPEPGPPRITKRDGLGAMGICLLSFLSTFPIVIPFVLTGDARLALRVSNAVAIVMLFVCGYAFGHYAGFRPWAAGLLMVAVGAALVGVAIALGG
jgi:VIT1/CCC1 family predicted Fe2+/Mn2+ transporter